MGLSSEEYEQSKLLRSQNKLSRRGSRRDSMVEAAPSP
jgi:hypothetical protein